MIQVKSNVRNKSSYPQNDTNRVWHDQKIISNSFLPTYISWFPYVREFTYQLVTILPSLVTNLTNT